MRFSPSRAACCAEIVSQWKKSGRQSQRSGRRKRGGLLRLYDEAEEAIRQIAEQKIYGSAGSVVVVEELLSGPEISLQAIADGDGFIPF